MGRLAPPAPARAEPQPAMMPGLSVTGQVGVLALRFRSLPIGGPMSVPGRDRSLGRWPVGSPYQDLPVRQRPVPSGACRHA
ncbi:hypothetical protein THIOKS11770037 [Thiocapsa sp. KS1]|nr:hypothetical protein THIOKS11770037 [Thiocapsa sp. KS1]